jgi:hypothetical protein
MDSAFAGKELHDLTPVIINNAKRYKKSPLGQQSLEPVQIEPAIHELLFSELHKHLKLTAASLDARTKAHHFSAQGLKKAKPVGFAT